MAIFQQERRTGIVFPILSLSLVGVAVALSAIGDDGLMLLDRVVEFISTLNIGRDFSLGAAGCGGLPPLLIGVVSSRIRDIFGRDAAGSMAVAEAGKPAHEAVVRVRSATCQDATPSVHAARIQSNLTSQTLRDGQQDCVFRSRRITVHDAAHEPALRARSFREAAVPRAAKFSILVTLSFGLWWGIWLALRSVVLALP
jgi:hypothetical protein